VDVAQALVHKSMSHWLGKTVAAVLVIFLSACSVKPVVTPTNPSGQKPVNSNNDKPAVTNLKLNANPFVSLTAAQIRQRVGPPKLAREFRGAWVATVANIDWPSRKGLSVEQLKAETIAIVQNAKVIGLNALVLQVRPSADAIYPSALEPWTEFISGEQGQAPGVTNGAPIPVSSLTRGFDPLQFWIEQSHAAGIQLHAWFNPFRAWHALATSTPAPNHVSKTHPHIVKKYERLLWLDPGESDSAQRALEVIQDVVRRYDIDGVHMDDYFYPYPYTIAAPAPNAGPVDFPDEPAWAAYKKSGGLLSRADWRRQNVNALIQRVVAVIQTEKPWLSFGISPFGLGKPSLRPADIKGFSQYDSLYADVELWLERGWLDYLVPQLYWRINQKEQAFGTLLNYWANQNPLRRAIWSGLYTSQVQNPNLPTNAQAWPTKEITDQIELIRSASLQNELLKGHVHFSMLALMQNRQGIADDLKRLYQVPALAPLMKPNELELPLVSPPFVAQTGPSQIQLMHDASNLIARSDPLLRFVVSQFVRGEWVQQILLATQCPCMINLDARAQEVWFQSIGRSGNESVLLAMERR
jgi:uncharacterized lipoprotein YddW (UPF0748 family)